VAQVACHNGVLPQGSPCSPIISDLLAHLLDVRLAQLAKRHKCTYSRYADDLTFSTNQRIFPAALALRLEEPGSEWILGEELIKQIEKAGFSINGEKTRMQCAPARQIVTGLTVNKKVNIRAEYYRSARAMCHALFSTGTYHRPGSTAPAASEMRAMMNQLEGVVNHIHYVKESGDQRSSDAKKDEPSGQCKLYNKLLFFRHFVILDRPLIICEGNTDNIYLKTAIRKLSTSFPKLATTEGKVVSIKIGLFKYTALTDEILRLGGGAGGIKNFISHYTSSITKYKHAPMRHPVILLIDNDSGAKDICSIIKSKFKIDVTLSSPDAFYHLCSNLYLVKTPEQGLTGSSCIEDLFEKSVLDTPLDGKKFNPGKVLDAGKEYGKVPFAEKIVRAKADTIDFSKFALILNRIVAVLDHYKAPATGPAIVSAA
jgi:RNA-directed DNA polymerase